MAWLFVSTTLSERLMRSCARQRFVAASSRSTEEKVASRRGSGRHWRRASRARALSLRLLVPLLVEWRKSLETQCGKVREREREWEAG